MGRLKRVLRVSSKRYDAIGIAQDRPAFRCAPCGLRTQPPATGWPMELRQFRDVEPMIARRNAARGLEECAMTLGTILLIILILILIGALPTWPYSSGWGYYPSGGVGLIVLILIILLVMGRI
jgi:uncharacterized protein DUF3309